VRPDVGVERRRGVLGRVADGEGHPPLRHPRQDGAGADAFAIDLAHLLDARRVTLLAEHLVEVLGDRIAQRVVEEVFLLAAADEGERKSLNHTFHMAGFYSQGGSIVILSSSSVGPSAARARLIASGSPSIPARRSPRAPNARASAGKSGLLRSASPKRPSYIR